MSVLLFPLLGFVINFFFLKRRSSYAGLIATVSVLGAFLSLIVSGYLHTFPHTWVVSDWISIGALNVDFSFRLDLLSYWMGVMITGVGTLIHLYAIGYMKEDDRPASFFAYMNLFVFFMLILVLSTSFLGTFVGWEGVGLCSYLLIGFWFQKVDFIKAAKKAFVVNRIGDFGFFLAIMMMFYFFGTSDYTLVFSQLQLLSPLALFLIGGGLLLGVMGKSAQFPLFVWLPDAMAGPTPVSALIHAATMVTAGIYLIARAQILFVSSGLDHFILILGLVTAVLGALIALKQTDIKKILAYSTMSQLGIMVTGLGCGAYVGALFHMTTHAFFKALLFLAAGSVIHALSGEQNILKMGGLRKKLPLIHAVFLVGVLAIVGFPPFSGFFSKDLILTSAFAVRPLYFWILVFASFLTAIYMTRLYFLVFWGDTRGVIAHSHDGLGMKITLVCLAILSLGAGALNWGHHGWMSTLFSGKIVDFIVPSHEIEGLLVGGTVLALVLVFYGAYRIFGVTIRESEPEGFIGSLLSNKLYIDDIFTFVFVTPFVYLATLFLRVEGFFSVKCSVLNPLFRLILRPFRRFQNGVVSNYFMWFLIVILLVLIGVNL